MKVYNLAHELVNRFVPLDDVTKTNMLSDAQQSYGNILAPATVKKKANDLAESFNEANAETEGFVPEPLKPLKFQERVVLLLDQWWMRYVFSILYMILIPKIKDYINGVRTQSEPENENDAFSAVFRVQAVQ